MKNYTSLEQSKQLIAAGLDPNTADMHYNEYKIADKRKIDEFPQANHYSTKVVDYVHPCWSVGALIQLMPEDLSDYELMINSKGVRYYDYEEWNALIWFDTSDGELTECCVKTILWLLKEGHLKKAEKENKMNKVIEKEIEKSADEYAEKHGFRVPYDGSNDFYDKTDVKASKEGFIEGAKWMYRKLSLLNTASLNAYQAWMGGTMKNVRECMDELGEELDKFAY